LKTLQTSKKKAICVNGVNYESLSEAARCNNMPLYKMQRLASGKIEIEGFKVSDIKRQYQDKKLNDLSGVLIKYPRGEKPLDMGLPGVRQ